MVTGKMIKILGIVATAIGLGATLLNDWVSDKKLDGKIAEKVMEALAQNKES